MTSTAGTSTAGTSTAGTSTAGTSTAGAMFGKVKAEVGDKVRKLLAQAEDPAATPEEAQAFTAKAQQLMSKYAIDLAMVTDPERIGRVVQRGWRLDPPYAGRKVSLVNAVSRANDCRAVYTDLNGGSKSIEVVGFPTDVDWVQALSASLELQMMTALAATRRRKPPAVHGRTFAVGFVDGFVHEVSSRLQQARRAAVAEAEGERAVGLGGAATPGSGPSVALVLVGKAAQVDDEYRARFPGARNVHRYTRLTSWAGYEPGRAAGRRASLARGAVNGRRGLRA